MSIQSRKSRGMKTQALVAEWFRQHGYTYATDAGAGRPGKDILNTPGLSVEVKARAGFQPQAWLRQAARDPGCWSPAGLTKTLARTEGWTFGVA